MHLLSRGIVIAAQYTDNNNKCCTYYNNNKYIATRYRYTFQSGEFEK